MVYIPRMAETLTIPEFAEKLGVSRDTIERLIKSKKIKAVKMNPYAGRTSPLLIPASELTKALRLRNEQAKR